MADEKSLETCKAAHPLKPGERFAPPALPERAGRAGDINPLPGEGAGDMIGELIAELEARRALGVKRYGRALQAFNGRDPFRDAADELLDQHAYLTQIRHEYSALREAVLVLAKNVRMDIARTPSLEAAVALAGKLEGGA